MAERVGKECAANNIYDSFLFCVFMERLRKCYTYFRGSEGIMKVIRSVVDVCIPISWKLMATRLAEVSPDARDHFGDSALHIAAENADIEVTSPRGTRMAPLKTGNGVENLRMCLLQWFT